MRRVSLFLLPAVLLAACGKQPSPVPASTSTPTAAPPVHADEVRFGLIGTPRQINVWELFDESGSSLPDLAIRNEYWPRLYHLALPDLIFQPMAAEGMPSAVVPDGEFLSAIVKLRQDIRWTDGSPFSAEDVAFTVNTALAFELGYDWGAYYPREDFERAEVLDPGTVKFVFRDQPHVGAWQYGALQGPIVQRRFWEAAVLEASSLLPDAASQADVDYARSYLTNVQRTVDELTVQVTAARLSGQANRQLEGELNRRSAELTYARNNLNKLLEQYEGNLRSARAALYALADEGEPTLGTWMAGTRRDDIWENEANPDFPFQMPSFDRAVYEFLPTMQDAEQAFERDEVDWILDPQAGFNHGDSNPQLSGKAVFLVINPLKPALIDPAIRQALACLAGTVSIGRTYLSLESYILPGNAPWLNPNAGMPCSGLVDADPVAARRVQAIQILKSAGYAWQMEPDGDHPGSGLRQPDGTSFPVVKVLALSEQWNLAESALASSLGESARDLGVPLEVEFVDPEDIRYEVFSSRTYDLAFTEWRLSLFPGYLCEWFGAGGSFNYGSERVAAECDALAMDSELESARRHVFALQSMLVEDLPFIPIGAEVTWDIYRNLRYPFEKVLGGYGGLYGAPSLAIPAQ